jgi:predicted DNA-binding transcriptional regulator AlpA
MPRKLEVLGLAELAQQTGVGRSTVRTWYSRGLLPEPAAKLACGPVWRARDVQRWIDQQRARELARAES